MNVSWIRKVWVDESRVMPTPPAGRRASWGARAARVYWLYAVLAVYLAACAGPQRPIPQTAAPFVPPTAAPTTPAAAPTPTSPAGTSTAPEPTDCTNDLRFVADETIPDGTVVPPRATLIKAWRVRNAGTCPWGPGYTLRFVAGERMDADEEQVLFPAPPGHEVLIKVHFRAPQEPGVYQSTWQAFDPQGQPFGDPVFLIIEVASPTPSPSPSPEGSATPET